MEVVYIEFAVLGGGPPDDMLYFAQYLRLHVGATSVSGSFRNDVPSLLLVFIQ